jgi:hypothetical protein
MQTQNPIDTFITIESAAQLGAFGMNPISTPTDAQCKAGNYKLGRIRLYDLSIAIEQPRHSYRTGIDPKTGRRWTNRLAAHYGYFSGTRGADGDPVDCFVGFYPQADHVYVINQYVDGRFDEHKVMLAMPDEKTARNAYLNSYDRGWLGLKSMVKATINQFKWWLKNGNMTKPLAPEHLPFDGIDTMKRIYWDSATALPESMTLDQLLYQVRKSDSGDNLLLDSVSMADILEEADEVATFDALVTPYAKLQRKMETLKAVMEREGDTVKPLAVQISDPFKQNGVAQVAALFELSDGQTVSIYFHNPDVDPRKIQQSDDLISWKFLLNRKDITIIAAPERGDDLNVREVARSVMKLAEKNSPAFKRANVNRAERMQTIENLNTEIVSLESELKEAMHELEIAKIEAEDRVIKEDAESVVNNEIVGKTVEIIRVKKPDINNRAAMIGKRGVVKKAIKSRNVYVIELDDGEGWEAAPENVREVAPETDVGVAEGARFSIGERVYFKKTGPGANTYAYGVIQNISKVESDMQFGDETEYDIAYQINGDDGAIYNNIFESVVQKVESNQSPDEANAPDMAQMINQAALWKGATMQVAKIETEDRLANTPVKQAEPDPVIIQKTNNQDIQQSEVATEITVDPKADNPVKIYGESANKQDSTMRTLKWSTSNSEFSLQNARYPTEDELMSYADWYKPRALFSDGDRIYLENFSSQDVDKYLGRPSTHSFPGDNNMVWIITPEEESKILAIENQKADEKKGNEQKLVVNPLYEHLSREDVDKKAYEYDLTQNEGVEGFNPYRDNYFVNEAQAKTISAAMAETNPELNNEPAPEFPQEQGDNSDAGNEDVPGDPAISLESLLKIGGKGWQSGDKHRVYFNDLVKRYGLELNYYGTGNISSASLDGEKISNSKAKKIDSYLSFAKLWYDLSAQEFQHKDLDQKDFAFFIDSIKDDLKDIDNEPEKENEPVPVPGNSNEADPASVEESTSVDNPIEEPQPEINEVPPIDVPVENGNMTDQQENQVDPIKSAFEAELNALKLETNIEAFDKHLDEIAGRIERAGLMAEMDGQLNAAADKLTELMAEAERNAA